MESRRIRDAADLLFDAIEDAFEGRVKARSVHVSNRRTYNEGNVVEIKRVVKVAISGSLEFVSPLETSSR